MSRPRAPRDPLTRTATPSVLLADTRQGAGGRHIGQNTVPSGSANVSRSSWPCRRYRSRLPGPVASRYAAVAVPSSVAWWCHSSVLPEPGALVRRLDGQQREVVVRLPRMVVLEELVEHAGIDSPGHQCRRSRSSAVAAGV
jgi:hypothetical protein